MAALSAECLFCKIIRGEIPCIKVAENAGALCFMDIFPTSKGHCLVIPKHHAVQAHEIPAENFAAVAELLSTVTKAIAVEHKNYNILQNNGELAHQAVMHAHFHIIPKTTDEDGLGIAWPASKGDTKVLEALAQELRARIGQ